ncbi:MAG: serine/threonine-protein kinase [Kofleriaceae bacterium]
MTAEGASIGSYRIVRKLGEGGMGTVWLGEHSLLGRRAAIKVLLPEFTTNEQIVQRFFNEARAVTSIADPGIVQVFDFGHTNGSAYIVMELLEGEAMDARLLRIGRFAPADAVRLMAQIATSLGAAHAKGVIHRDLKPENIFIVGDPAVTGGERTKILDFGIAKLAGNEIDKFKTRTGVVMGTPVFMSPEQCRGAATIDGRSDIYTLGCVLFTMLCGRPVFESEGTGDLIIMHVRDAPPAPSSIVPSLPPEMDALIARCLAKDPNHRFQTTTELVQGLAAVEAALYGMPVDEEFRRSLRMQAVGSEYTTSPGTNPNYSPRMTPAAAIAYRQQPTPAPPDARTRLGTPAGGVPVQTPTTLSSATGAIGAHQPATGRKTGALVAAALAVVVGVVVVVAVVARGGKTNTSESNTPAAASPTSNDSAATPPDPKVADPVALPVTATPDAALAVEPPVDAAPVAGEPPADAAVVAADPPVTTDTTVGGNKRDKRPPKRGTGTKQGGSNATTTSPTLGTVDRGD